MDFLQNQWGFYKTLVQHDFMEHRAMVAAAKRALRHYLDRAGGADIFLEPGESVPYFAQPEPKLA